MPPKSNRMLVKTFYWEQVEAQYRKKFLELMEQWDGSKSVYNSFYSIDVLNNIYKEAKESN